MKKRIYNKDIILILIATFFYLSSPMLINPIITGFANSIGSSKVLAGIIAGLMNITALILRPLAGNLTDHHSKYTLSSLGGILLLFSSIGYLLSTNPYWLIIFRIINGIGYVLCTSCMATWMANLLPRDKTGSGMGIYGLMNAMGVAIAPALGIFLYQNYGYRTTFIVAIIVSIFMVVLIQFVNNHGEPSKINTNKKQTNKTKIIQPKVLPVAIILMLLALPYFATQTYIVSYATTQHLSVATGLFFPIYAIILLILRILMKNLFDKVAFGKFFYIGLISTLISLIALSHLTSNLIMFIAAFGFAGGFGLMFSVCQSTALLLVSNQDRGLANSTFYIGLDSSMALGPILGGIIFSALPISYFYPVMLITLPLAWLTYFLNRNNLNHVNNS